MEKQLKSKIPFEYEGYWEISEKNNLIYRFSEAVPKGVIEPIIDCSNLNSGNKYLLFKLIPEFQMGTFLEKWLEAQTRAGFKKVTIPLCQ
ncbi:hypothetical protein [Arcticibacterium luteifluviistationis]|uniref:Uncharacterized protein n=1 Tax=Arcticibacterium luteifluviistationis TaxID=1784714 RepID=A0A2Z4G6E3_9BACT|nr:hypothetical protein [Arcticibacterium luteifluviistationis]AWV96715.1 hypothetical protein DJ013_00310 [Arcticibacterium luteifluviistationis]